MKENKMKDNFYAICKKNVKDFPIFIGEIYECEYDEYTEDENILVYINTDILQEYINTHKNVSGFGISSANNDGFNYRFNSKTEFEEYFIFNKNTGKIKNRLDYEPDYQFTLICKNDFSKGGWDFKRGNKFECVFLNNRDIKVNFYDVEYGSCSVSYNCDNLFDNFCYEKEYLSICRKEKLSLLKEETKWLDFLHNKKIKS